MSFASVVTHYGVRHHLGTDFIKTVVETGSEANFAPFSACPEEKLKQGFMIRKYIGL